MRSQLLQTDVGKQNIIDLYNYSISKNSDMTANAIFPYAQKAPATDNITADDIKDLFLTYDRLRKKFYTIYKQV